MAPKRLVLKALALGLLFMIAVGCGAEPVSAEDSPPANPPAQGAPQPEPPSAIVLDKQFAQGVMGKEVRGAANEDMGRIVDVVVDLTGQVRAAVIDFGGFLGVGSRKIAVEWGALNFVAIADKRSVVGLALTRDQVKAAPEYKEGKPIVALGASGALNPLPPPEQLPKQ
jgi:hypothetical protein